MLSPSSTWASLGLALILCIQGSFGDVHHRQSPNVTEIETETTVIYDPSCSSDVTIIDKTTILSPTTVPVTHYVSVPVTHYVDVTYYVNITSTSTLVESITESTTTTLHYTVSTTETDLETVSFTETDLDTVSITETDLKTITNTETDLVTITNTETDSTTITETTYTTTTIFSTKYDPCPTTCSISAGTVNLYFWPTNRPYSYPTTYVDTNLGYTFVSPSVYMYIPTAVGTNSLGLVGPSTSKWMLPLDLFEVSTIVDGSITRQLTLSDLGTDCPQTADPTAIATMVDSRCDPILAAPKQVSSWAYPCNACGRFGLFDPPYAVPTVTGGLLEPTTTATPAPITTTVTPAPTPTPEVGVLLIVYYSDGTPVATATVTTTGAGGTHTSSVEISATSVAVSTTAVESTPVSSTTVESTSESAAPVSSSLSSSLPTTTPVATFSSPTSVSPTTSVVTASATKVAGGLAWLISSIFIAIYLM